MRMPLFMFFIRWFAFVAIASTLLSTPGAGAEPARVAVLGDSITFAGHWVVQVESALRGTPRFADAEIVNFGLASETISGLSEEGHAGGSFPRPSLHERLVRILDEFMPTLVLACYGINDGIYQPFDDARFEAFQKGAEKLKADVEQSGARIIFITPPLYKADKPQEDAQQYDAVLDRYTAWLNEQAKAGWHVIDIRPHLRQAIADAKKTDPAFIYANDGIHPAAAGHRFMADAICAGLWQIGKLPGSPEIAADPALELLAKRNNLLKLAWLSKTKHTRPGVSAGLPLDQANEQAAKLLEAYKK